MGILKAVEKLSNASQSRKPESVSVSSHDAQLSATSTVPDKRWSYTSIRGGPAVTENSSRTLSTKSRHLREPREVFGIRSLARKNRMYSLLDIDILSAPHSFLCYAYHIHHVIVVPIQAYFAFLLTCEHIVHC